MTRGQVVVDASVLIELVLGRSGAAAARERLFAGRSQLLAPHLVDLEVTSALRRKLLADQVPLHGALRALDLYRDIPLHRVSHSLFLDRIFEMHANLTPYDAAYVALAEACDAPLVTFDAALARAPGGTARVEVLSRA